MVALFIDLHNANYLKLLYQSIFFELFFYSIFCSLFFVIFKEYNQKNKKQILNQIYHSWKGIIVTAPVGAFFQYLIYNDYIGFIYYQWDNYGIPYLFLSA